ncbi:MAG: hypothetical protein ACOH5I_16770 [Oligoflexus sp.]
MIDLWRKKQAVTVVWFSDKSSTRCLKLHWAPVLAAFLFLSGIIIFSIVSSLYLFYLNQQNRTLETQLLVFKDRLFSMQTRYENIFEKVYPYPQDALEPLNTKLLLGLSDVSDGMSEQMVKADMVQQETQSESFVTLNKHQATDPSPNAIKEKRLLQSSAAEELAQENRWQLENLAVRQDQNTRALSVQVDYRLSYKTGKDRSTGYVWAVVAYRHPDLGDQTAYAAAPDQGIINQADGTVRDFARGDRFYIRRFRDHSFSFRLPKESELIWIKLQVADMDGRMDTKWQKTWEPLTAQQQADSKKKTKFQKLQKSAS